MENHLIIIGGVAAGTKAAAKARREDPNLKITVFTDENEISYSACGLPYYIENLFSDPNKLLVRSKEAFKDKENIDIFTMHRVSQIKPEEKAVIVENLATGEIFEKNYTKLLIATGAKSFIPPVEGADLNNVYKLRNVQDALHIKEQLQNTKKAVVVGAGYIGMEVFESFIDQGVDTTMIEKANQLMPVLDADMAIHTEKYIKEEIASRKKAKIELLMNDGLKRLIGDDSGNLKAVETENGRIIDADLALIAIGVKPNIELAQKAGIEIGTTGAIKVDTKMQTSHADIYAAGDCAEQVHMVSKTPIWIPLGSTANKQGRVAAINITGGYAEFRGVAGSAVTKIFDFTVSRTGLSEREAQKLGIEYETALIPHRDRAGYMPNASNIVIKMLASKHNGKIIGVQVVGTGDADKRVNVIATALNAGMSVDEFLDTDLTYAPPYSPAIDPILIAAQVLQSKLDKQVEGINSEKLERYLEENISCCFLNADGLKQYAKDTCDENYCENIEKGSKLNIIRDKDQKVVVFCEDGMNSYMLSKKLKQKGYKDVVFVDGGLCSCRKKPEGAI